MSTRIFSVGYDVTELYNGKNGHSFSEYSNVVANDAADAIEKVKAKNMKASAFIDGDGNKKQKVKVTRSNFSATSVALLARTD